MTVFLYIGIFLLSLIDLLFLRTDNTFFGNAFRMQGVFLLWLLLGWSIISAKIKFSLHPWIVFGCLALQLLLVLLIDGGVDQRGIGSLGEPNALAAAVIFVWPFLFFTKKPTAIWIKISAIVFVLLMIFLSGSRSGMITFTLQAIFLLFLRFKILALWQRVVICLFLLLCSYTLPFVQQTGPYEDRSEVWQSAAIAGFKQPIFGHGFGNTEFALNQENKELHNNLQGSYVDSSHNLFLDWWVQGGIIGLGLLLLLLYQTMRRLIVTKNNGALVVLIGLLVALSFNPASVVSLIALWWAIGQAEKRG